MNLRPRQKQPFSGFAKAEVQKMEYLLKECKDQTLDVDFFKNLARTFNRSSNRAGKPVLKWIEIQSWFQKNQEKCPVKKTSSDADKKLPAVRKAPTRKKQTKIPKMSEDEQRTVEKVVIMTRIALIAVQKLQDISTLEFEAKSSKDGAWYDVDTFLSHRFLTSGEIEVRVRYVGFGKEEDEWVNARDAVRERSVTLEQSECQKLKVGDLVLCFQEKQDQARYYDACIVEIERRLHDIRGCRCLFLIRYNHDNTQENVRLRRLCCRPNLLARIEYN